MRRTSSAGDLHDSTRCVRDPHRPCAGATRRYHGPPRHRGGDASLNWRSARRGRLSCAMLATTLSSIIGSDSPRLRPTFCPRRVCLSRGGQHASFALRLPACRRARERAARAGAMFHRDVWKRWVHRELQLQLQTAGKLEAAAAGPATQRYVRSTGWGQARLAPPRVERTRADGSSWHASGFRLSHAAPCNSAFWGSRWISAAVSHRS